MRKRRAGRGALVILALMFAASAALRLGGSLGTALAESSRAEAVMPSIWAPVPRP